jgi:hypothetical protein
LCYFTTAHHPQLLDSPRLLGLGDGVEISNTLTLPAGPGSVGVVEVVKNDTATNNTSFHSLSLMVTTKIEVPVTWQ